MKTLKLTPTALSVLETDVLDHRAGDLDDGYDVIRAAFVEGALVVEGANANALADALHDLSNGCDDHIEYGDLDSDERKIYRAARQTFATLASKARRA